MFVVFPMLAVANTVELHWYDNDTELSVSTTSQSCAYGGTFDVPTPIPRDGYVFTGWHVKQAAQCSLSGLDPSIGTSWDATHTRWKSISSNGYTMANEFGTENSSDLNSGEWAVTFSYGTVKGMAKCSGTAGSYATLGTPSDTDGGRCWCQATNYTPNGGNQCNVASPSWVYIYDFGSVANCAQYCADNCAAYAESYSSFRRAVFGGGQ